MSNISKNSKVELVPYEERTYVTITEIAQHTGIAVNTIKRWAHEEDCPFIFEKPARGRTMLIHRAKFEAYIGAND